MGKTTERITSAIVRIEIEERTEAGLVVSRRLSSEFIVWEKDIVERDLAGDLVALAPPGTWLVENRDE